MTQHALYEGWVRHRRITPKPNSFRYGIWMAWIDLAEAESGSLPAILQGRFLRSDHVGDPEEPLSSVIRRNLAAELGSGEGDIFLLTQVRQAGYVFNPVSFYYVRHPGSPALRAVVAEVHNTPWGETHLYTVPCGGERTPFRFDKRFHVSPFMSMEQQYSWTFTNPDHRLLVHMENYEQGAKIFDATMVLRRIPLRSSQARMLRMRHPLSTYAVISRIYMQAAQMWLRRIPVYPHPAKRRSPGNSDD
jgi:DUF1365 family protein